jgi:hypothetical protein
MRPANRTPKPEADRVLRGAAATPPDSLEACCVISHIHPIVKGQSRRECPRRCSLGDTTHLPATRVGVLSHNRRAPSPAPCIRFFAMLLQCPGSAASFGSQPAPRPAAERPSWVRVTWRGWSRRSRPWPAARIPSWSAPILPTTRASISSAPTPWSPPPTSSPRSATIPAASAGWRPPTRSPTSTPWAAGPAPELLARRPSRGCLTTVPSPSRPREREG